MPAYDFAKQEIIVTDNKSHSHRYTKGKPVDWRPQTDAVILVPMGRIEWKSLNLQDGIQADKLPKTITVAEDRGGWEGDRPCFEWVLEE